MSEKIDDVRVIPGRLIKVKNTNKPKFSNEKNEYLAVYVEDADGDNERCLLFTERELLLAENRALKNPEDWLHKSFLQNLID
jgi:hypothetical protein